MAGGPNPSEAAGGAGDAPPSAKGRSSRIRPDYHRRRGGLWLWKWVLSGVAAVASLGWFFSGVDFAAFTSPTSAALTPVGRLRANHGPLARVHQAWESECEACHQPFRPINADSWFASFGDDWGHSSDASCLKCHHVTNHHANLPSASADANVGGTDQGELACSACHRDHLGREHDLLAVADRTCVSCHGDLKNHRVATMGDDSPRPDSTRPKGWDVVTGFADGRHPDFAAGEDPGRLKFNHALHMAAGMAFGGEGGTGAPFTKYSDLRQEDRARYMAAAGVKDPNEFVRLDCAACHETDTTSQAVAGGGVAGGGKRFLPVAFERHCAACHDTDLPLRAVTREQLAGRVNADGEVDGPRFRVPHGLQVAEVDRLLRGAVAAAAIDGKPELVEALDKSRLRSPGQEIPSAEREAAMRALAEEGDRLKTGLDAPEFGLPRLREFLFAGRGRCGECHFYENGADGGARPPQGLDFADTKAVAALVIERPQVPAIWYKSAAFDHAAHRATACAVCHPGANPGGAAKSVADAEWAVAMRAESLVPGIENCRSCHAPATVVEGVARGGIRHGCTVCHPYHGSDRFHRGGGTPMTAGEAFTSIEALLKPARAGTGPKPEKGR